MKPLSTILCAVVLAVPLVAAGSGGEVEGAPLIATPGGHVVPPAMESPEGGSHQLSTSVGSAFDDDPLGLVADAGEARRFSVGTDVWEVWICEWNGFWVANFPVDLADAVEALNGEVQAYYHWLSTGAYNLTFVPGGVVSGLTATGNVGADQAFCESRISSLTAGKANGAAIVHTSLWRGLSSGYGPGASTYPQNRRFVHLSWSLVRPTPPNYEVAIHELGHSILWPHSYTGDWHLERYDNPFDVMSGNCAQPVGSGSCQGDPTNIGTPAFNRYAAGWIPPAQVAVANDTPGEYDLGPIGSSGLQMLVIPLEERGHFITLGIRTRVGWDSPLDVEGVEAYTVDQRPTACPAGGATCSGLLRRLEQLPPIPFSLEHVYEVGDIIDTGEVQYEVTARTGDVFTLRGFRTPWADIVGHLFEAAIEWLISEGITKGCNPPFNDRFCPDDFVTRGELAVFLVRAMGYTDNGGGNLFIDDDGLFYENAADRLFTAGVTQGCNPPVNDKYCGEANVTRGQMAAFLVRAMGYTDNGGGNLFVDDDGHLFENAIDKLGAAKVTLGCNPPVNDKFCPDDKVTRGQMAAFLKRALG